ncbi:hypothetical protein [Cryobacterium ruanii]|uniref:Uncharacterized protein n=1 Tax=Cryobacterium ruanii TaxID=1259197 RepID=A0A4R9AK41_9MICO|nr:hypothetical protein [Cryobacterium ruanii]TFD63551.1 hypothetical protein E3T47_13850 [Cryobacterium ruanii]
MKPVVFQDLDHESAADVPPMAIDMRPRRGTHAQSHSIDGDRTIPMLAATRIDAATMSGDVDRHGRSIGPRATGRPRMRVSSPLG